MEPEDGLEGLVERAQAGDEAAQAEIVRRYAPRLEGMLHGELGPQFRARFDTEDVLQSSLGVVLRDLPDVEFRSPRAFEGWLFQAARRRLLDAVRRHKAGPRDVGRERALDADAARPGNLTTPTQGVERNEVTADVRAAVGLLEGEERRIVELRSYEGLTFGEIATIVGLAGKDAARDRYRRALLRMGDLLDRHRESPLEES